MLYNLIRQFASPTIVEDAIRETFAFKQRFYNEDNLRQHIAYLSDDKPHRTSHAYAVTCTSYGANYKRGLPGNLPTLNLAAWNMPEFPTIGLLYDRITSLMGLDEDNRVLFNVQEYYGGSEAVPKHCDGELLEFDVDEAGKLDIKRSIRPDLVAVLTLVNDTNGGGTRVHIPPQVLQAGMWPKDFKDEEVVICGKAGDLLIFNNVVCMHSVDPLQGTITRPDGLLRMTIGFRSLASRCHYMETDDIRPISKQEAEQKTLDWHTNEWPKQWAKIQANSQKAAF